MPTFSSGTTVANQLPGLINIVQVLPDNTAKVITPKNFRDSVYTLWENSMFKPTTISGSNTYYIGIDQYQIVNPNDVNIYPKVYFGKKQTGGQFIMTQDLIQTQNEVDFFYYNMKDNSGGNYNTSIAILAGTHSFFRNDGKVGAPILQGQIETTVDGNFINLNILNQSFVTSGLGVEYGGNINILSDKGNVSLNGFSFPKATEHSGVLGQAKDGYVLKYRWVNNQAIGSWESAFSQSVTTINSTSQVSITGDPIVLNGYRFTDTNKVAADIGGIKKGESFTNVDVLDMIRRIVYTYIPPSITSYFSTSLNGTPITLIEVGDTTTLSSMKLYYKITVNASTHSVQTFNILYIDGSLPAFPSVNSIVKGETNWNTTLNQVITGFPNPYKILPYTFSITDNYPSNMTYSNKLTAVLPYFYGAISTFSNTTQFLQPGDTPSIGLNNYLGTDENPTTNKLKLKLVEPIIGTPTYSNNLRLNVTTQGLPDNNKGFIYFGYPSSFPALKVIRDSNNLTVFNINNSPSVNQFATYSVKIKSASAPQKWASRDYTFYISKNITIELYNPVPWEFIFVTQSTP